MKQIFTFLACLFITNMAIAQCTPAPAFSVTTNKVINHPLQVKATITTSTVSHPMYHYHMINWGDGSSSSNSSQSTHFHDYANAGTYTVKYYLTKMDSTTANTVCQDSVSQSITVAYCNGSVYNFIDSFQTGTTWQVKFNTWGTGSISGSFFWDFGDGNTASGNPVTHTYSNATPKAVALYSIGSGCTDTFIKTINPSGVNCAGDSALFYGTPNGLQVAFTNTSTGGGTQTYSWNFGDGNTSTLQHPTHTYAAAGSYLVKLVTTWNGACVDSVSELVTVSTANNNVIEGYIIKDSILSPTVPTYKVWLIVHDSTLNTLTAVDSVTVTGGNWGQDLYQFNNKAVGQYRVKAAITNGPSSGTGYVPTYSTSSLSWSTASVIKHTGGTSQWHNITMQTGTITGGPGFIGGSISMGANKGTGLGIPNIDVYLLDATTNALVKAAKTDANGDYSFTNVPLGMYKIQPEWMGFTTTPSAPFTISSSKTKVENMWFIASNTRKTIKPVPASVMNVAEGLSFSIYPNPAKSKTTISWNSNTSADAAIMISDITGKKVYSNTVKAAGQTELDLSQLGKGLYFITISSENTQQTQKLVVE